MDDIFCWEGNYDKSLFYAKMGRFFAEEHYTRLMPYLKNKPEKVWFTIERQDRVIAFSSIEFPDEYVLFTTEYVEPLYRRQELFKRLTEVRFAYCRDMKLPIRTSTNLPYVRDYYQEHGFAVYRETKHYWFLSNEYKERVHGNGSDC